ncbi:MAG: heparan-alpha-glucosaminide N-acetyltransferase domain-containing protein [Nocardioides sp.]|nr:heparan-alpha-glucosaminide N-acetyltransferase domain-containing protein [Nocardioides sp.]
MSRAADPTRRARVVGLDVARCLALLGMIATHVIPAYTPDGADLSWSAELAGGRASALFAVLAGVTLTLGAGGTRPVHGRAWAGVSAGVVVRALLIGVLGMALAELDAGIAIILTYYGLLFCLGIPFLALRARALLGLAAGWLVLSPVLSHLVRPELPPRGFESPAFAHLADPGRLLADLTFTGYYPVVPWLTYLLVGMALGRLDLRRVTTAARIAAAGLVLAVAAPLVSRWLRDRPAIGGPLRDSLEAQHGVGLRDSVIDLTLARGAYGTTPTDTWAWLAVASPHTATPFDLARTLGSSLLIIGLCLLAARVAPRLWSIAFGAGAMTLTLYSLHVVLRTEGRLDGDDLTTYLQHVAVVVAIGALLALVRRRGPLEAVVAGSARTVRRAVDPHEFRSRPREVSRSR